MKKLDPKTRAQLLHLLMEGNSIGGAARLTGVSKTTILKLLEDAGVTKRLWEMSDVVTMLESWEAANVRIAA